MRETIKNRKGERVAVLVEDVQDAISRPGSGREGLVFVMHGLGGFKEQEHIATFAQSFKDAGYTVVRFDTTHAYGESDGDFLDATPTNYYEDLEDVIKWAGSQDWYVEPFVLVGHSLGGMSVALYAENYPEKIKGVAPIATVVSGKLKREIIPNAELMDWKKTGVKEWPSLTKKGLMKRLKWEYNNDLMNYDLLPKAGHLIMPVLMIAGEDDISIPVNHQKILFDAIPEPKEFHIIKDAPHTVTDEKKLQEIKHIFDKWIGKLEQK